MRRRLPSLLGFALLCAAIGGARAGDAPLEIGSELLRLPAAQREQRLDARFAASPLTLAAGRATLADAVALLAATGNATALAAGTDGAATAELPALTGTYWQGVVALCTAFDLVPEAGEGADRSEDSGRFGTRDNEGAPVIPQGGPLVLARREPTRPRPLLLAAGALLVEVQTLLISQRRGAAPERSGDLALGFRLEPHVPTDAVGATLVRWRNVEDGAQRKLEWSETRGGNRGSAEHALLHLVRLPERLPVIALGGEAVVQALEPTVITAGLVLGASAKAEIIGQEVSMRLLAEGETTANGQRGPGLALSVPTTLLGTRPKVLVTAGGQPLTFNPQGSQWSGGRIELFYRGPKLGEGEHRVSVSGVAALKQVRLPLQLALPLEGLPAGEPPAAGGLELQIPTRLSWPAGRHKLNEAVKLLAGANQVLLELGADERKEADLPAFAGTFWEGVIALCRAYDLAVLPPSQVVGVDQQTDDDGEAHATAFVTGGPLCLGPRRAGRRGVESCQASGILLMGVDDVALVTSQGLDGISRRADIAYRLRLEPRFDASLVGSAAVSWTSLAGFHGGQPLVVEESSAVRSDERGMQLVRVGRRVVRVPADGRERAPVNPGSSGSVSVTGLPADSVPLTLSGLTTLSLRRPVRLELPLAPGGRTLARVGGRTLVVRLATSGIDDQPTSRAGVTVEFAGEAIDGLDIEVRSPAGKTLRTNGNGSTGGNGRTRFYWYLPDLEPGQHTVVVTARERLGTLRLPFSLSVTTPP